MSSERLSPNVDFSAHGRCFARFFQSPASSSARKKDGGGDRKLIAKWIEKNIEISMAKSIDGTIEQTIETRLKNIENLGIPVIKIEPRTVRATQNRAQAASLERQIVQKSHEAMRFFLKGRSNESVRARKGAPRAQPRIELNTRKNQLRHSRIYGQNRLRHRDPQFSGPLD